MCLVFLILLLVVCLEVGTPDQPIYIYTNVQEVVTHFIQ